MSLDELVPHTRIPKGSLNCQNQLLLEQLTSSQSQDNSTQLQNQINLLQHLNSQFERQETFLESQLNHQNDLLRQTLSNPPKEQSKERMPKLPKQPKDGQCSGDLMPPVTSSVSTEPSSSSTPSTSRKRSASKSKTDGESQLKKSLKKDDSNLPLSALGSSDRGASLKTSGDVQGGYESRESSPDNHLSDTTGILSSMSAADIEKHLDSLVSGRQLTPRCVSRKCLPLIRKLMRDEHGWVFKEPVDPVELELENYFDVVKNPMCLEAVEKKLNDFAYLDIESVESDVKLVFNNAMLYNGDDNDIGKWAKKLLGTFNDDIKHLVKGKVGYDGVSLVLCCRAHFSICLFV